MEATLYFDLEGEDYTTFEMCDSCKDQVAIIRVSINRHDDNGEPCIGDDESVRFTISKNEISRLKKILEAFETMYNE